MCAYILTLTLSGSIHSLYLGSTHPPTPLSQGLSGNIFYQAVVNLLTRMQQTREKASDSELTFQMPFRGRGAAHDARRGPPTRAPRDPSSLQVASQEADPGFGADTTVLQARLVYYLVMADLLPKPEEWLRIEEAWEEEQR